MWKKSVFLIFMPRNEFRCIYFYSDHLSFVIKILPIRGSLAHGSAEAGFEPATFRLQIPQATMYATTNLRTFISW